ncbi:Nep1-domain-containing protein [Armillaria nabsnona]|nr:Nep1-domain-containing protein [Armillaria nabsnona]
MKKSMRPGVVAIIILKRARTTVDAYSTASYIQDEKARCADVVQGRPFVLNLNLLMFPVQAHVPKSIAAASQRRLLVVLEQTCLEAYRMSSDSAKGGRHGKGGEGDIKYILLNCHDYQGTLVKTGRYIADARPDITHQCLFTLLDSPLNKAGLLQVYIHTAKGVLIEVNPHIRRPRTFKRFSGLVRYKNPVVDHFPPNTIKLTLSGDAKTQRLSQYLATLPQTHNIAVFVGAMARGRNDFADAYVDEKSVSTPWCYPEFFWSVSTRQ